MALTDNLVSYWKFDESSGDASDSVNGNTLTNFNTVAYSSGKINNGADFEADNSEYFKIDDGDQTGLDIAGDVSISCWVKFETDVSTYQVNKWGAGTELAYAFTYTSGGTGLRLRINDGTSTTNAVVAWTPSLATWYHLVVVYDASAGTADFYVDASQQGSQQSGLGNSINNNNQPFAIGVNYNEGGLNTPFDGMMDEIGIWSRTLTSGEVTELYNSDSGLQYPFGEATGNSNFLMFMN